MTGVHRPGAARRGRPSFRCGRSGWRGSCRGRMASRRGTDVVHDRGRRPALHQGRAGGNHVERPGRRPNGHIRTAPVTTGATSIATVSPPRWHGSRAITGSALTGHVASAATAFEAAPDPATRGSRVRRAVVVDAVVARREESGRVAAAGSIDEGARPSPLLAVGTEPVLDRRRQRQAHARRCRGARAGTRLRGRPRPAPARRPPPGRPDARTASRSGR